MVAVAEILNVTWAGILGEVREAARKHAALGSGVKPITVIRKGRRTALDRLNQVFAPPLERLTHRAAKEVDQAVRDGFLAALRCSECGNRLVDLAPKTPEGWSPATDCLHDGTCTGLSPWSCHEDALHLRAGYETRHFYCNCGPCHPPQPPALTCPLGHAFFQENGVWIENFLRGGHR